MKANQDIREMIESTGLFYWQVAYRYGLSDGNFSRLLRRELPRHKKERILGIISELAKERGRKDKAS